jgi:hypothetical protein
MAPTSAQSFAQHTIAFDLCINVSELLIGVVVAYNLNVKMHLDAGRSSAIATILYAVMCYVSARFGHISWYIVPLYGGINWTNANFFLLLLLFGIARLVLPIRKGSP